jgi:hypothetical protein
MKLRLLHILGWVLPGTSVMSLPVAAETPDYADAPTEILGKVSGQLTGFDSLTSEALLLIVVILLVLAVIAHKPKAP